MICQKCKAAAASVCITQIVDFQKTDIYLCQKCANESGAVELQTALNMFDVMPGHLVFGPNYRRYAAQSGNESCPECGITFAEIQKSGKLGCANCYNVFRAKLRPFITRIHRSAQHRGKNPSNARLRQAGPDGAEGANVSGNGSSDPGADAGAGDVASANAGTGAGAGVNTVSNGSGGGEANNKAPYFSGAAPVTNAAERLEKLKAALKEAIGNEEYEKAAELRDQIKAAENRGAD